MQIARALTLLAIALAFFSCAHTPPAEGHAAAARVDGPPRTYSGCVRQLDANANGDSLQAIVNQSAQDQVVVHVQDASLQALVLTAFIWEKRIRVEYVEGTPNIATRVTIDREEAQDCKLESTQEEPEDRYCVLRLDGGQGPAAFRAVLRSPGTSMSIAVNVDHPLLQALLETAFVWNRETYVWYEPSMRVTRVKLDRFYTRDCSAVPPGSQAR